MALKKPKITRKKIYQEFDLKEIFGVDLSNRNDLKEAIGQVIIDRMIDRTATGKDINNMGFQGYSKKYMESDDFKIGGKSKTVNMRLLGDMLADIDIIENSGNKIKIGFSDNDEIDKAYNHLTTKTSKHKMPKRSFFGVNKKDIDKIKTKLQSKIVREKEEQRISRESEILLEFIENRDAIAIGIFDEEEEENGNS